MSNWLKYFTRLVIIGLVIFGCRKEQPEITSLEENCDCANEVTADFQILEPLGGPNPDIIMVETNHVLDSKSIKFRAKEDNAEYTWYIGADIETDREINRYFIETWAGSTIPITLVVKKEPNLICNPNDDGYDSVVKYMDVYSRLDSNIIEGTFRVAEENSLDSIDITFNITGTFANNIYEEDGYGLEASNFDGNGASYLNDTPSGSHNIARSYRAFRTKSDSPNPALTNYFYVVYANFNLMDEFFIHFGYKDNPIPSAPFIQKKMYGRKL